MSRRHRVLVVALAASTPVVVAAAVTAYALALRHGDEPGSGPKVLGVVLLVVALISPAAVGLAVALRLPGNRIAWILLVGPLSVALVFAADGLARLLLIDDPGSAAGAWARLVAQEWPVIFVWPLALAFTFPDGRLPSARWIPWWRLAAVSVAGAMTLIALADPMQTDDGEVPNPLPFGLDSHGPLVAVFWVFWVGLLVSLVAAALSLRARYRAGDAQRRRQVLWLAYGALLLPLWLGGGSLLVALGLPFGDAVDGIGLAILEMWPAVAVAVAVSRHGLWGIDRLLSRTIVYAVLTALLAAVWALVALLAGALVGRSALTASLATLAAAVAFRPVRARVQAAVDRRFARRRIAAVRVVREFLDAVHDGRAEPEDVGEAVARALDDPRAEVVVLLPESGGYADASGARLVDLPDDGRARAPIGRDDRELGVLLRSPEPPVEPDVLEAVIREAAPAVELARLRVELRLQLAEVASSRERIAQAGYAERRRIERDLHDGAQQRLVTLGIVLRRLQRSLPPEARVLVPALDGAVAEVAEAISDLRTIAAGVRPPRLDEGLAAALADLAGNAAVPVEVSAGPERAPPDVEAAAYFVACEALTNAVKHGAPSRVSMRAAHVDGVLRVLVEDDGVGGAAPAAGTGMAGMRDRVAAHGGSLVVDSPPGGGTRVRVEIPCGS